MTRSSAGQSVEGFRYVDQLVHGYTLLLDAAIAANFHTGTSAKQIRGIVVAPTAANVQPATSATLQMGSFVATCAIKIPNDMPTGGSPGKLWGPRSMVSWHERQQPSCP